MIAETVQLDDIHDSLRQPGEKPQMNLSGSLFRSFRPVQTWLAVTQRLLTAELLDSTSALTVSQSSRCLCCPFQPQQLGYICRYSLAYTHVPGDEEPLVLVMLPESSTGSQPAAAASAPLNSTVDLYRGMLTQLGCFADLACPNAPY